MLQDPRSGRWIKVTQTADSKIPGTDKCTDGETPVIEEYRVYYGDGVKRSIPGSLRASPIVKYESSRGQAELTSVASISASRLRRRSGVSRLLGLCGFPFEPTPETAPRQPLFVALYVGPQVRRIAIRPVGASADDVEPAVVVLDVLVAVPQITVGCAVTECHGNCHGSNLQVRR